jgi:hypothetical protein
MEASLGKKTPRGMLVDPTLSRIRGKGGGQSIPGALDLHSRSTWLPRNSMADPETFRNAGLVSSSHSLAKDSYPSKLLCTASMAKIVLRVFEHRDKHPSSRFVLRRSGVVMSRVCSTSSLRSSNGAAAEAFKLLIVDDSTIKEEACNWGM